jgi:hypothetical protein
MTLFLLACPVQSWSLTIPMSCRREFMEEFRGKSFFHSVKDWNQMPIEGALLEHAKDMVSTFKTDREDCHRCNEV